MSLTPPNDLLAERRVLTSLVCYFFLTTGEDPHLRSVIRKRAMSISRCLPTMHYSVHCSLAAPHAFKSHDGPNCTSDILYRLSHISLLLYFCIIPHTPVSGASCVAVLMLVFLWTIGTAIWPITCTSVRTLQAHAQYRETNECVYIYIYIVLCEKNREKRGEKGAAHYQNQSQETFVKSPKI